MPEAKPLRDCLLVTCQTGRKGGALLLPAAYGRPSRGKDSCSTENRHGAGVPYPSTGLVAIRIPCRGRVASSQRTAFVSGNVAQKNHAAPPQTTAARVTPPTIPATVSNLVCFGSA